MSKKFSTKKLKFKNELGRKKNVERTQNIQEFFKPEKFDSPTKSNSRTLVLGLIISIFFGFVSGLLCLMLFFSGVLDSSPFFAWVDVDSLLPTESVIIQNREEINVLEDERISEIIENISPVVVGIFKYKVPNSNVEQNIYSPDNFLGNGLILTSDGWVATTNDVVSGSGSYAIVIQTGQVFKSEQIKQDTNLGLVFLKINSENLPVAALVKTQNVSIGEKTLLIKGISRVNSGLLISRVNNKNFQLNSRNTRDSENHYLFLSLVDDIKSDFLGTPVFNFNKQVMGLVSSYNNIDYIIPVNYFKKSFDSLITKGGLEQTYLGIEYINLASTIVADYSSSGVLITSIKKDSPLIDLEVAEGDVIIQVNDEVINGNKNLTNLIQEYKTGNKISLTILDKDDNIEKTIEVILK